jgi:hypothetical protein
VVQAKIQLVVGEMLLSSSSSLTRWVLQGTRQSTANHN